MTLTPKQYYVYILASRKNGTLYVGMTSDLVRRIWEHKSDLVPGFTRRYGVKRLVCFEVHQDPLQALTREKRIKVWKREWKVRLIEGEAPEWCDLYSSIVA